MSVAKVTRAAERSRPDDSHSPREKIVRDIIRGLYEGRYRPGQRLVEAQLTAAHKVSRGPVREALNRLSACGIVELSLQRGAQVRNLTVDEAIDILLVVEGLVRIAARLAALRIDRPGAKEMLTNALGALASFDPSSSTVEYAIARGTFYAALTSIANNAEISRIFPTVQIHLIRVQFHSVMRGTDRRRQADYRRIVEAVLSGRPAAAEAAVRTHLGAAIKALHDFKKAHGTAKPA